MPRQARLDVPGSLHHVIARGIERQAIFRSNADRSDFLSRLDSLAASRSLVIYAWSLLTNHVHLLVRSTKVPLSSAMRRLMTGYAGYFNRTHKRSGHVFQNRFKSVLCQDEPYFLELVRYIHLNPVRAGMVAPKDLANSSYTGHAVILGTRKVSWQDRESVLARFSKQETKAVSAYERFVSDGLKDAAPRHLEGGGLIRSYGGWQAVVDLRRGRERYRSDERILGEGHFVEQLLNDAERDETARVALRRSWDLQSLIKIVCEKRGISRAAFAGPGKSRPVSEARRALSYLWLKALGQNGQVLAEETGMKPVTVYASAKGGEARAQEWMRYLES